MSQISHVGEARAQGTIQTGSEDPTKSWDGKRSLRASVEGTAPSSHTKTQQRWDKPSLNQLRVLKSSQAFSNHPGGIFALL